MSCSHIKELHRWWTSATVTLREATRAAPQTQLRRVMVSKLFHQLLHAKCEQFIKVKWMEEWKDCVVGKVFPRGEKIMKGHLLRSYTRHHSRRMATWLDRWRLNKDSSGLSNHAYAKTSCKTNELTKIKRSINTNTKTRLTGSGTYPQWYARRLLGDGLSECTDAWHVMNPTESSRRFTTYKNYTWKI